MHGKIWNGFEPDPNTTICDGCACEREDAVSFQLNQHKKRLFKKSKLKSSGPGKMRN